LENLNRKALERFTRVCENDIKTDVMWDVGTWINSSERYRVERKVFLNK